MPTKPRAARTREYKLQTNSEVLAAMPPERQARIRARAAELIQEELTMRQLRKARKLTQAEVAKTLNVTQDVVSRMEARSDVLLSTLRKTIRAMGGDLELTVRFPDYGPVRLAGFTEAADNAGD